MLIVIETHQLLKNFPVMISKRKKNQITIFSNLKNCVKTQRYLSIVMPSYYHSYTNTLMYYLDKKLSIGDMLKIYLSIHDVTCSQMQYFNEY